MIIFGFIEENSDFNKSVQRHKCNTLLSSLFILYFFVLPVPTQPQFSPPTLLSPRTHFSFFQKDHNFASIKTSSFSVPLFVSWASLEIGNHRHSLDTAMDKDKDKSHTHSFFHSFVKHFKFGSSKGNSPLSSSISV